MQVDQWLLVVAARVHFAENGLDLRLRHCLAQDNLQRVYKGLWVETVRVQLVVLGTACITLNGFFD